MMKKLKFKLNKCIPYKGVKHAANDIVTLECDDNGTPKTSFWRRRLKDARIDNGIELVKPKSKKTEKTDNK